MCNVYKHMYLQSEAGFTLGAICAVIVEIK